MILFRRTADGQLKLSLEFGIQVDGQPQLRPLPVEFPSHSLGEVVLPFIVHFLDRGPEARRRGAAELNRWTEGRWGFYRGLAPGERGLCPGLR